MGMSSQVPWSSASVSFATVHEWVHGHGIQELDIRRSLAPCFHVPVLKHFLGVVSTGYKK
jgi:hypothetical protein